MTRRLLAVLATMALWPVALLAQRGGAFPHRRHANLFPTCDACHAGVATGDAAASLPAPQACRACHNGTDVQEISWTPRPRAVGMLKFSHPVHMRSADSSAHLCATCHSPGASRMDISEPGPAVCLGCHRHNASGHLAADNNCATCHLPLTQTAVPMARIAAFPKPPSHDAADFIRRHAPAGGATAQCAICHARESCARCHVNAATLPATASLAPDARVAQVVAGKPAVYPTPADHRASDFEWRHGSAARDVGTSRCATCHTRSSCVVCHTGEPPSAIVRRMPEATPGSAPGVRLMRAPLPPAGAAARGGAIALVAVAETIPAAGAPQPHVVRVHDPGFRKAHGAQAAASALTCTGCHSQRFCSDCHAGEGQRRYHPANFAARHAPNAFGREAECQSCHNAEAFCRECHRQAGLASKGRLDVAFHTAQPQWLLQHGRAARQGLANCVTCHTQRDCLTCHSTTGWGINPHGSGFDAARMGSKAMPMCLICHVRVPNTGR